MLEPSRRPSLAGVAFSGTEYFELPSRAKTSALVDEFVAGARTAGGVTIAAVLGEWGEGKSELYAGKIRASAKTVGYSLAVPASTIANSYEIPRIVELLQEEPVESTRFLTVLVEALGLTEANREIGLPEISSFSDAREFVSTAFRVLSKESRSTRVFIFIDEFEELLNQSSKLRQIISGMKELVNGECVALQTGGEFAGLLHLIIACTPSAYYRISRDRDVEQIFGGFGRRVVQFPLSTPRKAETIQFIDATLRWSWEGNLPSPPPFRNTGVHELLSYVTRGNLGNLVQLVSKILSLSNLKDLRTIDGGVMLAVLDSHRFTIYGAETPALESQLFSDMISTVSEQGKEHRGRQLASVFRTICGEHIPHNVRDLREADPSLFETEHSVRSAIEEINQSLSKRHSIDRSVLCLLALNSSIKPSDVLQRLVDDAGAKIVADRLEGRVLVIDGFRERAEYLEDRLTHFFIDSDGAIRSAVFFPKDEVNARAFFSGVTSDTAREIAYLFQSKAESSEPFYLLSESLRTQLFPTPVPLGLEFILDRDKRLELWRASGRELDQLIARYMPAALPELVARVGVWQTSRDVVSGPEGSQTWLFSRERTRVRVNISALLQDPKKSEVREALELVRRPENPVHLSVLIYTGEFSLEAKTALDASKLGPDSEFRVLPLRLNVGLLRRLIAVNHALHTVSEERIDEDLLRPVLSQILSDESELLPSLDRWMAFQARRGVVIEPLADSAANLGLQVKTLRYFLNYPSGPRDLSGLWKKTQAELVGLQMFGGRKSLVPDIEEPQFLRIVEDLKANGLLTEEPDGFCITKLPAELRALELLSDGNSHDIGSLGGHFIDCTGAKAFENVILEILKDKGLVSVRGQSVQLQDLEREAETLNSRLHGVRDSIRSSQEIFERYGLLFIAKKKDERWVTYSSWLSLLGDFAAELDPASGIPFETRGPRLRLLKELLEQFDHRIVAPIRAAARQGSALVSQVSAAKVEFSAATSGALKELTNVWGREGSLELIDREDVLSRADQIAALHELPWTKLDEDQKQKLVEGPGRDHFLFQDEEDLAPVDYYSPKFAQIRRDAFEVQQRMKQVSESLGELLTGLKGVRDRESRIATLVTSTNVPTESSISILFKKVLLESTVARTRESKEAKSTVVVRLVDLVNIVGERSRTKEESLDILWDVARQFRSLVEKESALRTKLQKLETEIVTFEERFGESLDNRVFAEGRATMKRVRSRLDQFARPAKEGDSVPTPKAFQSAATSVIGYLDAAAGELEDCHRKIAGVVDKAAGSWKNQVAVLHALSDYVADLGDREWVAARVRELNDDVDSMPKLQSTLPFGRFRERFTAAAEGTYVRVASSFGKEVLYARALEIALRETLEEEYVGFFDLRRKIMDECKVSQKEANSATDFLFENKILEPLVRRRVR